MPDTTTLMITLPADEALAAQFEQRLARHAEVMRPPPQTLSLEAIFLIVSIVAAGAATASSIAAIRASQAATDASRASVTATQAETIKALLEIRQMLHEQGRAAEVQVGPATGPMRSLAEHYYRESLTLHERQGDAGKAATTCNQITIVAVGPRNLRRAGPRNPRKERKPRTGAGRGTGLSAAGAGDLCAVRG
jgi:hypothetical protein